MSNSSLHFVDFIVNKADHSLVTTTLAAAGAAPVVAPGFFGDHPLQSIYYLLLIPPAALHLYATFKRHILPGILDLIDKLKKK